MATEVREEGEVESQQPRADVPRDIPGAVIFGGGILGGMAIGAGILRVLYPDVFFNTISTFFPEHSPKVSVLPPIYGEPPASGFDRDKALEFEKSLTAYNYM